MANIYTALFCYITLFTLITLHPCKVEKSILFLNFIVIQLQLYAISPHPSPPPQLNPPPSLPATLPLDFVHVSFIVVPVIPEESIILNLCTDYQTPS